MSDQFRVKNRLNISPKASPTLNEKGDIAYDSGSDVLKYYDGAEKTLATTSDVGTVSTGLSNHLSDTTDAHDASAISVTATGNLASTDVQAALQELQGDVDSAVTATSTFATDERLLRSDGTGRGAQASGITVTDADVVSGVTQLNVDNVRVDGNTISTTNTDGDLTLAPNGTGQVLIPSGSQASPGIAFTTDPTVGFWYAGGYSLIFSVAGTANLFNFANHGLEILGGRPLTLFRNDNVYGVQIDANDSMAASYSIKLPTGQGTFGQVMQNDGSGNLSWASPSTNGINFITYGDAENNATTGWATYADTGGLTYPVDGTGGSPNTTLTATSSSPLRGTYSFLITKNSGADRSGEGVSYDFTTAAADNNKKLSISWDYEASTDYTGSSGTEYMTCYVYDVTNATLIATSNVNIPYGSGSQQITFDATTSNSYRLIFHVAGTGTTAWTYKFDNVKVGPQEAIIAPAIGDWQAWTPTGSHTTNVTYTGYKKRVGDQGYYRVLMSFTGVTDNGAVSINMPTGEAIDTTKILKATNDYRTLGTASIADVSVVSYPGLIVYKDANSVTVTSIADDSGTGGGYVAAGSLDLDATGTPFTSASGDFILAEWSAPIANWSSNIQLANSRVEYASNSGMTDTADLSSFVNDPNGSPIPATTYAAGRFKTVRFKNPIQAGDTLQLQVKPNNSVNVWFDCPAQYGDTGSGLGIANNPLNDNGLAIYDVLNSTDVRVYVGRYYASTNNWSASNTSRWRVVKYSNATPTESSTHRKIDGTLSNVTLAASGTVYDFGSISLPPGKWMIYYKPHIQAAGTSQTYAQGMISETSATETSEGQKNMVRTLADIMGGLGRYLGTCVRYVDLATTTTYYGTVRSAFTGTAPAATATEGQLFAIRMD